VALARVSRQAFGICTEQHRLIPSAATRLNGQGREIEHRRAALSGTDAERYDRARYPAALIDDQVEPGCL
jgi:hypothetical protein